MKEKITNFTFTLILFISIYFIFKNNQEISKLIIEGTNLFFTKVFTSLFPMFIINDLLISLNIPYYFYKIFNNIFQKLFKTSAIASYVLIMSLISGTPSQAYILETLVKEKKITVNEANHYLYFTYFSNPLFLTLMLSSIFNTNIVLKIIIIHYLSNIVIAFIMRNNAPKISEQKLATTKTNISLTKSIKKSMSTLLMILGTIIFYMILTHITINILPLNNHLKVLTAGFFEITRGLNLLTTLDTTLKIKELIAISIISFGGLSINTQIKGILEDTNIKYIYFLKGRIMQTIISVILIIII